MIGLVAAGGALPGVAEAAGFVVAGLADFGLAVLAGVAVFGPAGLAGYGMAAPGAVEVGVGAVDGVTGLVVDAGRYFPPGLAGGAVDISARRFA